MSSKLSNEAIYLKFSDNNHFEPMVCVQDINQKICLRLCKFNSLSESRYMCRRKGKDTCAVLIVKDNAEEQGRSGTNICNLNNRCSFSKYLKKINKFLSIMQYEKLPKD